MADEQVSQEEANYRAGQRGGPHCGICQYYGDHSCTEVAGDISPYGLSNIFAYEKNPWAQGAPPQPSAPADEDSDATGNVQIGNRTYPAE